MANKIQVRRGTTAVRVTKTFDAGEPAFDTDLKRLFMGDGSTAGGIDIAPPVVSFKNRLINGEFGIWQRGTSFSSASLGGAFYTADRWQAVNVNNTLVVSQTTSAPQAALPTYVMKCAITSVAGVGNTSFVSQKIESVRSCAGRTITISFKAWSSVAGKKIGVSFDQGFGTGGSTAVLGTGQSITLGTTTPTTRQSLTFVIPDITGTTVGVGDFLQAIIWLDAGSNFAARSGSIGQLTADVYIDEVQVEIGAVATEFEKRPLGLELMLCQRYCPAFYSNATSSFISAAQCASTTQAIGLIPWLVTPRVPPTSVVVSAITHFGVSSANSTNINTTNLTYISASLQGAALLATVASGLVAGNGSALYFNTVSGFMYFEGSEL